MTKFFTSGFVYESSSSGALIILFDFFENFLVYSQISVHHLCLKTPVVHARNVQTDGCFIMFRHSLVTAYTVCRDTIHFIKCSFYCSRQYDNVADLCTYHVILRLWLICEPTMSSLDCTVADLCAHHVILRLYCG